MLALLLAMGGAWAQGPTQVTQFTTDMIADWQGVNENVTLADLQALGFEAVDVSVAQAWTGAPQGDYSWLIYGFDAGNCNYIMFDDSGDPGSPSYTSYTKSYFYNRVSNGNKYFYTGAPNQAIKLTPDATGKVWTLDETPDYNLDLNVVYYQKYALKEIPANWQVKVDGVDKTAAIDGDSLKISETAQVLLTPDHPERVKKVILVDEVVAPQLQTVHVGNFADATFYFLPGETWEDAINNHPTENAGFGIQSSWVTYNGMMVTYQGGAFSPNTEVNPNAEYEAII